MLTRFLARELGQRSIAVNTLAPNVIATDFGGGTVRDNLQVNAFIASQTALGRVGEAVDNRGVKAQRIEVSGSMMR